MKNYENPSGSEVIEVVLVQCNLVDNQYQRKSEVTYCTHSKSYAYLLNHSHTKRNSLETV